MSEQSQTTPLPSRADIVWAVKSLTASFSLPPGRVERYLASIYPQAPGPDVGGDPRNPAWAAERMKEMADGR